MSNYLAIATVTATIGQLLQVAASSAVPGALVTTVRPEAADDSNVLTDPAINLYLFQVAPNPAWRNSDLPARRADGSLAQRLQVALDMHYLLTFYGDESQLVPQRLLGSAVSALNTQPLLTSADIQKVTDPALPGSIDSLEFSNLVDQVESIKINPIALNLEEMSKLWSVFFQTPYALSVAYQASAVLIEDDSVPQPSLPVRARYIYGTTFKQPAIDKVGSSVGENEPIVLGTTLVISGRQLQGDETLVAIDGTSLETDFVTPSEIRVALVQPALPEAQLQAGVQGVQVVHSTAMGLPATSHPGVASNVIAFVLRPTITASVTIDNVVVDASDLRSGDLTIELSPDLGQNQRFVVLLNQFGSDPPVSYSFAPPFRDADSDTVTVEVTGIEDGDYLVRIQVDGAESSLEVSADPENPQFIGPLVTIP